MTDQYNKPMALCISPFFVDTFRQNSTPTHFSSSFPVTGLQPGTMYTTNTMLAVLYSRFSSLLLLFFFLFSFKCWMYLHPLGRSIICMLPTFLFNTRLFHAQFHFQYGDCFHISEATYCVVALLPVQWERQEFQRYFLFSENPCSQKSVCVK